MNRFWGGLTARWRVFQHHLPEDSTVWELYDIAADPWQLQNLAGDPKYGATLEILKDVLSEELKDCEGDSCWYEGPVPGEPAELNHSVVAE